MVAITLATCLPTVLPAGQGTAFGTWCNEHGDRLQIDENGMRGGEHVSCVWGNPVAEASEIRAPLHCKTLKLLNGEWVSVHEATYDFLAQLSDPDHLQVAYKDGRFAHTLQRCQN